MHRRHFFIPHVVVIAAFVALSSVGILFYTLFISPPLSVIAATYGDVSTFVGKAVAGDGSQAVDAYFDFPEDFDVDASGNFYVADQYNNVIRKIDSSGIVSTVAGTGSSGSADGAAASATFYLPRGITLDDSGNIYVSDTGNNTIRKISGGTVTTIVSSGLSAPQGLEVIGSTLYIADSGNNAIKSVSTSGGTVSTLTTGVGDPKRLVASSNGSLLYVADNGNHRVVSVNTSTGVIDVIAGSGSDAYAEGTGTGASFQNVWGVALSGNTLYVSDHNLALTDRIRKIDLTTKITTLLYQDQYQQELIFPSALYVKDGYVYVVNAGLGTFHRFNVNNGTDNSKFAGKDRFGNTVGDASTAVLGRPSDLALTSDRQYLYIAMNNLVRRINRATGEVTHVLGVVVDNYRGEGTDVEFVRFSGVTSIAVNSSGTKLYVIDRWNNRIRGIDLTVTPHKSFLVTGAGLINTDGTQDNGYQDGKNCGDVRTTGQAGCSYFRNPIGLALSPDDASLYIADTGNNRIRKVRISDGQTSLVAGTGTAGFKDGASSGALFNKPSALAIDSTGTFLYVADTNNHRIRKIDLETNMVSTLAGKGTNGYQEATGSNAVLSFPGYIKMGGDGMLYFTESGSQRIRFVDPLTGTTKLVAGSGTRGLVNGAQTAAQFNNLKGLAVDNADKKIYVADSWNDVVRKVDITGVAPYTQPAPKIGSLVVSKIMTKWAVKGVLSITLVGSGFKHGARVKIGSHDAVKAYVGNPRMRVDLPVAKMVPGMYDITVINLDGQISILTKGLSIMDSRGKVPNKYFPSPYRPKPPTFLYGKKRVLVYERAKAAVLLREMKKQKKTIPASRWSIMINAYAYGNYPVKAIIQELKYPAKVIHPNILWDAWKNSTGYKQYINRP